MERQALLQDVQQRIAELFRASPAADLELLSRAIQYSKLTFVSWSM